MFKNYSKLPYIRRDLSFLIDVSITYESILKTIEKINVHSLKKYYSLIYMREKTFLNRKKA